jgi:hypothetical protein
VTRLPISLLGGGSGTCTTYVCGSLCSKCQAPLRLIALIQTEDIAKKILTAMHLPADIPALHPARPPPREAGGDDGFD